MDAKMPGFHNALRGLVTQWGIHVPYPKTDSECLSQQSFHFYEWEHQLAQSCKANKGPNP